MSCSSSTVLSGDFLKLEKSNLDAHQFKVGKRKYIDLTSSPEHDLINKKGNLVHETSIMIRSDVHNLITSDYKREGLKLADQDMSQRLDLFKKYLFPKALQIIGKSNEKESQAIRRTPSIPFIPPKFGGASRPPSFLERELFPMVKCDMELPTSLDDKSSAAQLTIFYGGTINVYDNVTIDKAQAIMLLAGENSLSAPVVESVPTIDMTKVTKPVQPTNLPSICKLQADLPIARKYSLQRFLEKRRDRKADNSPYAPSTIPQPNNDEPTTSDDLNDQRTFLPLPFPSRGHFFPIAANKGC